MTSGYGLKNILLDDKLKMSQPAGGIKDKSISVTRSSTYNIDEKDIHTNNRIVLD